MNDSPVQLALREMRSQLAAPRALAAMAVVALVLGFAGPFGTFERLTTLPRLVYWVATVFSTYGLGYSLSIYAKIRWGRGRPFWQLLPLMAVPAGLSATAVVSLINVIALGPAGASPVEFVLLLLECLLVAFGVVTMVLMLGPARRAAAVPAPDAAPLPPPILERVPLPRRGRLLALSVEDHYVDIVTDRGKTLVLMRLADAIRETGAVAGLQVHRSHWVAREAVVKMHRGDGKTSLELSNGLRLPVSRGYLPAVREAGLG